MEPVISIDSLSMHFRRSSALDNVSLTIQPGTVFALLGENGAGKTTMIRILTGYQQPSSGSCRVCGVDPTRDPLNVRRQIGYVSDVSNGYQNQGKYPMLLVNGCNAGDMYRIGNEGFGDIAAHDL